MANVKITALTNLAAGDVAVDDVFIIDDVSVPESKKITVANLRAAVDTIATSNINTVSSNVDSLETSVNTILANVNAVQDNVASVGSNTEGFTSNQHTISATANILPGSNNIYSLGSPEAVWQEVYIGPNSLKLGALTISDTGGETITVTGASGAQGNLSTAAVAGVSNLTANVVSLESNTADLAAGIAGISVDTAAGTETRLNANLDITNDNVTSLTTTVDNFGTSSNSNAAALAAGIATLSSVDTATGTETRLNANLDITNDNVAANFTQLDANINVVQGNVTNITDGTTPFSAPVTFTDNVTISGSLIVTGAQVDLGVQSATVDNNFIELSAELAPGDAPATDSGLLINRGNKGNVFIGDHLGEDGVIFVRTQTPDTNTIVAIESFMDLHANAVHVAAPVNLDRVHFGLRASEDTGLIIDDSGANINFVAGGSYLANVHYDGTINSQNAIISPAVFSDGVELQANDSATLFSAYSNDFITYTQLNANVDIVQDNVATLTTTVDNFGTYANTNLDTKSNVSATYIQLNANIDVVQDNVASITTRSDAFGTYANSTFSTIANAASLAAGISGIASAGAFPTGDYGLLDAANSSTDSFGVAIAGLTTFDMKTDPSGSLDTEDLGALT